MESYHEIIIINSFVYNRILFRLTSKKVHNSNLYYHTVVAEFPDEQGKIEFYLPPKCRLPHPNLVYRTFLRKYHPLKCKHLIDGEVRAFNSYLKDHKIKFYSK